MIGIIDTNENLLQDINDRIHQALEIAPVIISTLTEDEKNSIQTLDSTWI